MRDFLGSAKDTPATVIKYHPPERLPSPVRLPQKAMKARVLRTPEPTPANSPANFLAAAVILHLTGNVASEA
jgi:hypothetical protein